jgi:hypothetical protein
MVSFSALVLIIGAVVIPGRGKVKIVNAVVDWFILMN